MAARIRVEKALGRERSTRRQQQLILTTRQIQDATFKGAWRRHLSQQAITLGADLKSMRTMVTQQLDWFQDSFAQASAALGRQQQHGRSRLEKHRSRAKALQSEVNAQRQKVEDGERFVRNLQESSRRKTAFVGRVTAGLAAGQTVAAGLKADVRTLRGEAGRMITAFDDFCRSALRQVARRAAGHHRNVVRKLQRNVARKLREQNAELVSCRGDVAEELARFRTTMVRSAAAMEAKVSAVAVAHERKLASHRSELGYIREKVKVAKADATAAQATANIAAARAEAETRAREAQAAAAAVIAAISPRLAVSADNSRPRRHVQRDTFSDSSSDFEKLPKPQPRRRRPSLSSLKETSSRSTRRPSAQKKSPSPRINARASVVKHLPAGSANDIDSGDSTSTSIPPRRGSASPVVDSGTSDSSFDRPLLEAEVRRERETLERLQALAAEQAKLDRARIAAEEAAERQLRHGASPSGATSFDDSASFTPRPPVISPPARALGGPGSPPVGSMRPAPLRDRGGPGSPGISFVEDSPMSPPSSRPPKRVPVRRLSAPVDPQQFLTKLVEYVQDGVDVLKVAYAPTASTSKVAKRRAILSGDETTFSWGSKKGATKDGLRLDSIRQVIFGPRTPNFVTQNWWTNPAAAQKVLGAKLRADDLPWRCFSIVCGTVSDGEGYERTYDFVCVNAEDEDDALKCVYVLQNLSNQSLLARKLSWSQLKVLKVGMKVKQKVVRFGILDAGLP